MRALFLAAACLLAGCAGRDAPDAAARLPIIVTAQGAGVEQGAGATGLPSQGQVFQREVPFYGRAVPLPPGDWTVLTSRSLTAARLGPVAGTLALVQAKGTTLGAVFSVTGNALPLPSGFALHALCTAADLLWNEARAATPNGTQDCAAVTFLRPVEWRGKPQDFEAQIARGLDQVGLRPPDYLVVYAVTEADPHWQLTVTLARNPDLAGVAPDPATQRARSAWRASVLAADPARARFVDGLKAEVPPMRDRLRRALEGPAPAPRGGLTPA